MKIKNINRFLLIYIVVTVIVLAMLTTFSTLFYFSSRDTIVQSVRSRLISNVKYTTNLLAPDAQAHKDLVSTYYEDARLLFEETETKREELEEEGLSEEEISQYFTDNHAVELELIKTIFEDPNNVLILDTLESLVELTEVTGIYTINYDALRDEFFFVVDTDPTVNPANIDEEDEDIRYVFPTFSLGEPYVSGDDEEYKDVYDLLMSAYNNPDEVQISQIEDEFGSYFTGVLPLVDDQGIVTLVCVDVEDSFIKTNETSFITTISTLDILLLATFGICGVLIVKLLKKNDQMRAEIQRMAFNDALTNLPNRAALMEELDKEVSGENPDAPKTSAAFFIDLDNFKKVNDTEGHLMGDKLLKDIANFLRDSIGENSFLSRPGGGNVDFVARLGGDEFILILRDLDHSSAEDFAKMILDKFNKTFESHEVVQRYSVSLSIGVKIYHQSSFDPSGVLKSADEAMYKAKRMGKGCYFIDKD